jgi:aminopeptidase YwaD
VSLRRAVPLALVLVILSCEGLIVFSAPREAPPVDGAGNGPGQDNGTGGSPGKADGGLGPGLDAGTGVPDASVDLNPLTHLEYLASDAMRGRDSPSAEQNTAARYVKGVLERYGVAGANTADPGNPYYQGFDLMTFAPAAGLAGLASAAREAPEEAHREFGHALFEHAFFLDGLSEDGKATLRARLSERSGTDVPPTGSQEPGPGAALLQPGAALLEPGAALLAGNVQNVVGKLEGTGPKKSEVILLMCHLDHIGVGGGGAAFNGADDNASGSSTLLAAVPVLAAAAKRGELNRTVVLVWTTAEEKGLVGAKYLADNPLPGIGPNEIVGVINMDMVGRWDDQRISIIDTDSAGVQNYFGPLVEAANQALADPFDRINRDLNAYRERHDGAAFSAKGEAVLLLFEGLSNPQGGGNLIAEYHQATDDIPRIMADNGGRKLARVRDLLVEVAKRAANR